MIVIAVPLASRATRRDRDRDRIIQQSFLISLPFNFTMAFILTSLAIFLAVCRIADTFSCHERLSNSLIRGDGRVEQSTVLRAHMPRRQFVLSTATFAGLVLAPSVSRADEEELSKTLFNPDGSLKEGIETEAKFRTIEVGWDVTDSLMINIDGDYVRNTPKGSQVRISYKLPEKWVNAEGSKYFDRSEGINAKACNHIIVYQAQGKVSPDRLEKASTIGIAKALDVPQDLQLIQSSDLMSGRTLKKGENGLKYFEFDCAVAPKSCSSSTEDLGLGFCPYESIYLLSATWMDDRLYVMAIESDRTEWKRSNSDLKTVRSSFQVERV